MAEAGLTIVYTTLPDGEAAERLARELVDEGFAACANIFPPIVSFFSWEGKVERGLETAMLLKTTRHGSERLMAAIRARHPYQTPAIFSLDADQVDVDYLAWLRSCVAAD